MKEYIYILYLWESHFSVKYCIWCASTAGILEAIKFQNRTEQEETKMRKRRRCNDGGGEGELPKVNLENDVNLQLKASSIDAQSAPVSTHHCLVCATTTSRGHHQDTRTPSSTQVLTPSFFLSSYLSCARWRHLAGTFCSSVFSSFCISLLLALLLLSSFSSPYLPLFFIFCCWFSVISRQYSAFSGKIASARTSVTTQIATVNFQTPTCYVLLAGAVSFSLLTSFSSSSSSSLLSSIFLSSGSSGFVVYAADVKAESMQGLCVLLCG